MKIKKLMIVLTGSFLLTSNLYAAEGKTLVDLLKGDLPKSEAKANKSNTPSDCDKYGGYTTRKICEKLSGGLSLSLPKSEKKAEKAKKEKKKSFGSDAPKTLVDLLKKKN